MLIQKQINFTGNPTREKGATMFFMIETVLDFSYGTFEVLWF